MAILAQNYAYLLQINLLALWDDALHRGGICVFSLFLHNFSTLASYSSNFNHPLVLHDLVLKTTKNYIK
jgi:hypothetical protein